MGQTLGEALLTPHASYYRALAPVFPLVKGMAHVTGGGLPDNVPRMLPDGLAASLDTASWPLPPIFTLLQEQAHIAEDEMYRVFNMGLGMVLACAPSQAAEVAGMVEGGEIVGRVTAYDGGERVVFQS